MTTYRHKARGAPGGYQLKTGTLALLTAASDIVTTAARGDGVAGTLDMDLWTLISGVAAAGDVRKTVPRYTGGPDGSLVGIVDINGALTAYGILQAGTSEYYMFGIYEPGSGYHDEGIYKSSLYYDMTYAHTSAGGTLTLPAAANVSTVETAYGIGGVSEAGLLNLSLYTLIAGVVAAGDVRFGVVCYVGGPTGTLIVPGTASGSLTLSKETGANARGGSGTCAKLLPTSEVTYGFWDFFVKVPAAEFKLSFYYKSFHTTSAWTGTLEVSLWDSDNYLESPPPLLNSVDVAGTYDATYQLWESAAKTAAAEGLCRVRIEIVDGTDNGGVYIDDIVVTET
jgi:hypothetical protein